MKILKNSIDNYLLAYYSLNSNSNPRIRDYIEFRNGKSNNLNNDLSYSFSCNSFISYIICIIGGCFISYKYKSILVFPIFGICFMSIRSLNRNLIEMNSNLNTTNTPNTNNPYTYCTCTCTFCKLKQRKKTRIYKAYFI